MFRALGTQKLVGSVTLARAGVQWLADCQIAELQPIPLRSTVLPRPGAAARSPSRRCPSRSRSPRGACRPGAGRAAAPRARAAPRRGLSSAQGSRRRAIRPPRRLNWIPESGPARLLGCASSHHPPRPASCGDLRFVGFTASSRTKPRKGAQPVPAPIMMIGHLDGQSSATLAIPGFPSSSNRRPCLRNSKARL